MLVKGIVAVVARRNGIGTPVKGQGSICQDVPPALMDEVNGLAREEAKALSAKQVAVWRKKLKARRAAEAKPARTGRYSHRPYYRRHGNVGPETHKIVDALVRASKGLMPSIAIVKACHAQGLACTNEVVAEAKRKAGFPTDSRIARSKVNGATSKTQRTYSDREPVKKITTGMISPQNMADDYLRRCVEEWNRRVAAAYDLATDPLVPLKDPATGD